MKAQARALLVQVRHDFVGALNLALAEQSVVVTLARNCGEAALEIGVASPPHVVFTEAQLIDGDWADILELAAGSPAAVNVIVVAPFADVPFYVRTIERGAFDFIVPPLSQPQWRHVIRTAVENSLARREKQSNGLPRRAASGASQAGWVSYTE
jgi:two-component system, NtrC family, nitrogen regulation response regulator NtrX